MCVIIFSSSFYFICCQLLLSHIVLYACCYGLRLSNLINETTYLLTYVLDFWYLGNGHAAWIRLASPATTIPLPYSLVRRQQLNQEEFPAWDAIQGYLLGVYTCVIVFSSSFYFIFVNFFYLTLYCMHAVMVCVCRISLKKLLTYLLSICESRAPCRCRAAGGEECEAVRVLPGTVRRRHVHDPHPPPLALLRVQPHHPLRPHLQHGPSHLHSPAGRRRKDLARYASHTGADHGSWVMGHGSWVVGHGPRVMGYGSWVMGHGSNGSTSLDGLLGSGQGWVYVTHWPVTN